MSKVTIKPKSPSLSPGHHEKWKPCRVCGTKWITAELKFDNGSTLPEVGETLTGASSGDKGVVTEVETLISGAWGDSDAAGYLHVDTLSGDDPEQYSIFTDGELINGSTAGSNCLTADGQGNVKIWGLLYPKRLLIKEEGSWYCMWHHPWRFRPKKRDEDRLVINEDERNKE